jgi:hypothetical protein
MGTGLDRSRWDAEADGVFAELARWRATHPAATLDEIEVAVEDRIARLRKRLLTDTIQASARASVGVGSARVVCAACGERLQRRGRAQRTVQTAEGALIEIERAYGSCPRCQARVFPPGPRTGTSSA